MKIDEPKTPYREASDGEEDSNEDDEAPETLEIQQHLSEAEENARKNAMLNANSMELLNSKLLGDGEKLKDEDDDLTEEEKKKHAEFKKKMKSHYKGEANAAQLLKKKYT